MTDSPEKPIVKFRPHHFMCTLGFQGKGYSPSFIKNYKSIVKQLTQDANTPIQVIQHVDSICKACPHQTKEKRCDQQSFIEQLDKRHQDTLGLQQGQTVTWAQAKSLIKARMTVPAFHQACDGCRWKEYGVCEDELKKLLDEDRVMLLLDLRR